MKERLKSWPSTVIGIVVGVLWPAFMAQLSPGCAAEVGEVAKWGPAVAAVLVGAAWKSPKGGN